MDAQAYVTQRAEAAKAADEFLHPFVLVVGDKDSDNLEFKEVYAVVDGMLFRRRSVAGAFHFIFCVHWFTNLSYAPVLQSVYQLVEMFIYRFIKTSLPMLKRFEPLKLSFDCTADEMEEAPGKLLAEVVLAAEPGKLAEVQASEGQLPRGKRRRAASDVGVTDEGLVVPDDGDSVNSSVGAPKHRRKLFVGDQSDDENGTFSTISMKSCNQTVDSTFNVVASPRTGVPPLIRM